VNTRVRTWRPALWVLALALAVAAVPLPSLAQESSPPAVKPGIRASVQKIAVPTPLTPSRVQVAKSQGTTTAPPTKPSFLKTKAGAVVIGILAAGTGYALYTTSHDRIHSVIRQGQK